MNENGASGVNAQRWSSADDDWRGYKRVGGRIILDQRGQRVVSLVRAATPDARVLDVGCGTGVLGGAMAAAAGTRRIEGVDGLRMTDDFPVSVQNLDARSPLPFGDGTFDLVVCLETIEHVHDTNYLVSELARVMKPQGYGIFSVPRLDGFLSIAMLAAGFQPPALECSVRKRYGSPQAGGRVSGHVSHFTKRAFEELLADEGLRVTAFEQVGIYSSWRLAYGHQGGKLVGAALWAFSQLRVKQDDMIVRVERRPG